MNPDTQLAFEVRLVGIQKEMTSCKTAAQMTDLIAEFNRVRTGYLALLHLKDQRTVLIKLLAYRQGYLERKDTFMNMLGEL